MRHAAYEAPTPWALGLVVTSSLCGVSSGNMQRSSSPASALANLFMDRDRWSRWIKLSEMTWNVMNLGTRRHARSIWCQEGPTFERRRRRESQVSFKATDHHWHVHPPALPELGPLLFSQWNDIFLHTHVTLLHMNHLKDRSAALPALKVQNVWRLWRLKIWYDNLSAQIFTVEVPLWPLPGARGDRPTAAGHSGRQTPNSVLSFKFRVCSFVEEKKLHVTSCYLKKHVKFWFIPTL